MADVYWRYGESRQPLPQQPIPTLVGKRSRSNYDVPGGNELHNYFPRGNDRGAIHAIRDSDSIGASYDQYLHGGSIPAYSGGQSARPIGGMPGRPVDDLRVMSMGSLDPGPTVKERTLGLGSGRTDASLPPDASSTLFVEGLPSNCTRREVAHIFHPFVGYKEVRLVSKESRRSGSDPLVLCFVDFFSPSHSATAMDALQGYKFDEHDRDLVHLRLQFARYPGARSGCGPRQKR